MNLFNKHTIQPITINTEKNKYTLATAKDFLIIWIIGDETRIDLTGIITTDKESRCIRKKWKIMDT